MKFIVLGLLLFFVLFPVLSQPPHQFSNKRLLVRFTDNAKPQWDKKKGTVVTGYEMLDAVNRKYGCIKAKKIAYRRTKKAINLFVLEFKDSINVLQAVKDYKATQLFKYVEPDYKVHGAGVQHTQMTPNDPRFNTQWGLRNTGTFSLSPAVPGADINIVPAWDITTGDSTIVVAINDSGLKWDHPELSGRVWQNRGEIPNNGTDDDGNGFVDDIRGWDFVNSDNNPADDHGHGTNVTGILGLKSNNNLGFASIDWHCKLMPLKVLDQQNSGSNSGIIQSIYYAIENGARVINLSLGTSTNSSLMQEAVDEAADNKVIVVACMMNFNNQTTYYPAGFSSSIAVGSTNPNDQRSSPFFWSTTSGSNFGDHIDVVAPGNYIYGLSHNSNTNYGTYWGGTSQATPHVAGLVALLLAQDSSRGLAQVRRLITENADDQVGRPDEDIPGWDRYHGHGRINAYKTLLAGQFTSAKEKVDALEWKIYPIPAQQSVKVQSLKNLEMINIKLIDMLGRVWHAESMALKPGLTEVKIPEDCKGKAMIQWVSEGKSYYRFIAIL